MAPCLRTFSALALLSLAAACGSDPVDDLLTRSLFVPEGGTLDGTRVVVPRGRALAFVAQPMGYGETLKLKIHLESRDRAIAGVEPTVEMNQFVVYGRALGATELEVTDENGRRAEATLRVEVVAP